MKIPFLYRTVAMIFCLWLVPLNGETIPLSDPANQHNFSNLANSTNNNTTPSHTHPKANAPANGGTTEICIFCHTPHNATPQSSLWNRYDPASMGSFPVYGGQLVIKGSFNVSEATTHSQYNSATYPYPNGASKLCLSCHDGVTAIGTILDGTAFNMLGASNINAMGDPRLVINLATSHPISFVYDNQVLTDIGQVKPNQYKLPADSSFPPAPALNDVPLDGQNRMQCTTCHDPHEDTRAAIGLPFWRHRVAISGGNVFDDVCNSCHRADKTGKQGGLHDTTPPWP